MNKFLILLPESKDEKGLHILMQDLENSVLTRIPVTDKLIKIYLLYLLVVINQCPQLAYTHASIYSNLILFNDSKYMYRISMTLHPIYEYRAKTGNNVSEFTHLFWIMPSYYSSPKHKSLLPKYLIHFSYFCTQ